MAMREGWAYCGRRTKHYLRPVRLGVYGAPFYYALCGAVYRVPESAVRWPKVETLDNASGNCKRCQVLLEEERDRRD